MVEKKKAVMESQVKLDEKKLFYKRPAIPGRKLPLYDREKIDDQLGEHCCELMEMFLADPRIALTYSPMYREYDIPLQYKNKTMALQGLFYCPWCSKKLSDSVRQDWFEILDKEYNLDNPWSDEQEKLVPKEFRTDEWWKKRGL